MVQKPRSSRWSGWWKRKPSLLRPFPSTLRMEELETRDVPATFTWTGLGTTANWSEAANWTGPGGLPAAPTGLGSNSEDLVFPQGPSKRVTNNDFAIPTFNSIAFSTTAAGQGYTLGGNDLILGVFGFPGTGFINVGNGSTGNVIQMMMVFGGGNTVQQFTVGGGLTISGPISGGSASSLLKSGTGTLTLSGNNVNFMGNISIGSDSGSLIVAHQNALGNTGGITTVGSNSSLELSNVGGPIAESVQLNGPGVGARGALFNLAGNNTWNGPITLGTGSKTEGVLIGAENKTSLTINGIISDTGAGQILSKEGKGEVVLNAANTYRGLTYVNSGILTVGNANALGFGGTPESGTIVNSDVNIASNADAGQLRLASPSSTGFTIFNEHLTLNGAGQSGLTNAGSLTNTNADNTWAGPVTLGSPYPNGVAVTIGTGAGTLTISGVISTPNGTGGTPVGETPPGEAGSGSLTKVDTGILIFNNANTYSCPTIVAEGILIVRDSQSLGTASTTVASGATLQLEVEAGAGPNGSALPNFDAHGRNLSFDSVTADAHRLEIANRLFLNGQGVLLADGTRAGALYSASGINVWTNNITSNNAGIGVALDPRPGHPTPDSSYFINDYSLTTTAVGGAIQGGDVTKLQPGHLILPVANTYTGRTFVRSGWITIQNNRSLGAVIGNRSQTLQPETLIYDGAAVHLRTLTPNSDSLFIDENFIVSGVGPKLPYGFISQKGALMNIGGDNYIGVNDLVTPTRFTYVALNGQVGIGVEQIAPLAPGSGEAPSRLTIVGWMRDDTISSSLGTNFPAGGATVTTQASGGIIKLGSKHLQLEGEGTFKLDNEIREGTLAARHNMALGTDSSGTYSTNPADGDIAQVYSDTTTTVASGANLHLNSSLALTNGGISSGVQIAHEELVLNSPGQQVAVAGALVPAPSAFNLTFTNHLTDTLPASTRTTANFAAGVTAAEIQAALNALPSVRGSEIQSVRTNATGNFTLTFTGPGTGTATTITLPAGSSQGAVQAELLNLTSIRRHEIQTVDVIGGTATDSFVLFFNGIPTPAIPVGSTNLVVQNALNTIAAIGPTGVTVAAATIAGGTRYTVTFNGPLVQFANQPPLTSQGIGIASPLVATTQNGFGGSVVVTRTNAVPTGFIYTIEYGGELSFTNLNQIVAAGTAIPGGAVQTVRDGLNGFVTVSESVTGTPLTFASPVGSQGPGNRYTIEYFGDLANVDLPQIVVSMPPAATGTMPTVATNQNGGGGQNERHAISVVGSSSRLADGNFTGSFTLTYKTQTTALLPITAGAELIQSQLNALSMLTDDVGSVTVTKTGNVFTIVFGTTHTMDTPELVATAITSPLGTPEITISGSTIVDGAVSQASLVSLSQDNTWRGPVMMNTGGRIATVKDTRINFLGSITEPNLADVAVSDFVKRGQGEVLLGGLNSFQGTTWIDAGYATVANSGALGGTVNGTVVENNAQLQIQGSLTVSGENLTIRGTGVTDASLLKDKWFNVGPASTNGVVTSGNQAQSTRITSVATDPQDPNVIYIATAGGGAWKSKDRGINWTPLFDDTVDAAAVMYGGHIAVAPSNPNVVYFATGEANGGANGSPLNSQRDTFAGTGVYISVNAGMTWRLITGPNSNNPLYGLAVSKLIVDPTNAQRIYVASGDATVIAGTAGLVANNVYGLAVPGVYRFDGSVANADWFNLTGSPSLARQGVGAAPFDTVGPLNAGPNDDFRIMFPQSNATWSDIALVQTGPGFGLNNGNRDAAGNTWVLYAALGESQQRYAVGTTQGIFNAVYRTEDPAAVFLANTGPTWWIGRGTIFPVAAVTSNEAPNNQAVPPPTDPDLRERDTYYDIGENDNDNAVEASEINSTNDPNHAPGRNEWIKISAVVTRYHNENPTDLSNLLLSGLRMNASVQVYTTNLGNSVDQFPFDNENFPNGRTNEFLDIQRSTWDGGLGGGWTSHINQEGAGFSSTPFGEVTRVGTTNPTSNATGRYDSVLISPSNTFGQRDRTALVNDRLYLGGKTDVWLVEGIRGSATPTWTPFTQGAASRPEDFVHALYIDRSTSNLLIGTDGGLWYDNTTFNTHSFQNMNGSIAAAQFNNIDPHPTDFNQALGAAYNSGLQQFDGSLAWDAFNSLPAPADDRLRNAGDVRYDPKNPLVAWASVGGRLYRTQDGGQNWTFITTGSGNNSFPVYIDPLNSNRVLFGGSGIFESQNATASDLTVLSTFVNRSGGTTVAMAPAVYQGAFVPDDDFPLVTDKLPNTPDPDTIYITNGSTVRVTKNRGLTWINRSPFANYFPRSIEFLGSMANTDQDIITTDGSNLTLGGVANAVTQVNGNSTANELQSLVVTATGGTYTLTIRVNGILRTTGNIPFNASAATIEAALNGLPGMINAGGTGQVRVQDINATNIITDIAVDPSNRDTIYVTVRHAEGDLGLPTVFRSTNAGRSWQDISGNATSVVPVSYLNAAGGAIPDNNTVTGLQSSITAASTPGEIVSSLAVTVNITHADDSQLTVYLRGPNGLRVPLALNRSGANFVGTIFTDSAATAISGGTAPYTGLFRPEAPLSAFTGLDMNQVGTQWTLEVYDGAAGVTGTLNNWTLDITTRPQNAGNLPFTQAWTVTVDPRTDTVYVGNDKGVWRLPNASATNSYSWTRFGDSLPDVQVHDLVLNQTLNTLTAATYGRGMYQLFLTDYQPSVGGIRVISGNSTWTGNVQLTGDLTITADGTQRIQDGIAAATLNILGTISDTTGGNTSVITKSGLGTVVLSGANTYGGQTLVQQGVLRVQNPLALGLPTANTVVAAGAALELTSDLALEPVLLNGNGLPLNGHFTGSLRSRANNNVYTGQLTLGTNATIGVDPGNDFDSVINPGVQTSSSLRIGTDPRGIIPGTGTIVDGNNNFTLDKELAGTLILASSNAIGGEIRVNQGALRVEHANALGSFGPFAGTKVLDGAQVQIARNAATLTPTVISNESLSLSGTGIDVTGALRNVRSDSVSTGSNDNTWSGPITFTMNPGFAPETNPDSRIAIRVDDSLIPGFTDTLNINTNIQQNSALGSFGLIKVGPGRLNLMQANSYTGTTEVGVNLGNRDFQGGSLRIENPNSLGPNALSNSVQTLSVVGLSGTYRLTFNGETTGVLPANATALQVENALNALSSVGQAEQQLLAVTGSGSFTLTFNGQTTGPITTASGAAGIASALNSLSSVNRPEIQDILVSTANGYFTLSYQGQTTAALPQGSSNASVAAALNALSTIVPGSVAVTTSPTVVAGATVYRVTFSGSANRDPIVAATYTTDTQQNGSPSTGEVQRVALFSSSGTFNLTFNGLTTIPLPFNATALDVQKALNALPSIGGVNGSVAVSEAAFGTGRRFTIVFAGSLANRDVPQITAAGVGGPVAAVVTVQDGLNGSVSVGAPNHTVTFGGDLAARDVPQIIPGNFTGTASVTPSTTRPGAGVVVSETTSVGGKVLTVSFQRPLDLAVIPQISVLPGNISTGLAVNIATIQAGGAGAIVNNTGGPGSLEVAGDPLNLGSSINVIRNVVLNGPGVAGVIRVSEALVAGGTEFTLTFDGALGNTDIPLVLAAGDAGATTTTATVLDGSRSQKELQTVTVLGTAGTFTISLNGLTTAALPFNATAAQVQAALNALTSLGGSSGALNNANGNNTYSGSVTLATNSHIGANPNTSLTIPVLQDPTPLTVPAPTLTKVGQGTIVFPNANAYGGFTTVRDGVLSIQNPQGIGTGRNEVQSFSTVGTTGGFSLSFNGQTTVPLVFDIPASGGLTPNASVQNALNALSSVRRTEIQTVTLGNNTSGTFTLAFNGSAPTAPIAFSESQANISALFQGLSTVGSGNATVTRSGNVLTITFTGSLANTDVVPVIAAGQGGTSTLVAIVQDGLNGNATVSSVLIPGGRQYTVTFGGDLANTNLPQMIVQSAMVFTNTTVPGTATTNEVQTAEVLNTAGQFFQLSFNGQQTGLIPAGASAAAVETALEGLSTVRRNEVQQIVVAGTSGQFSVTITDHLGTQRTATNLAYNITANNLRIALENLSNVGTGNIQVTAASVPGSTTYTITFIGALGNRNIPPIIASGSGGASTSIVQVTEGLGGDLFVTSLGVTGDLVYTIQFQGDLANTDVPQITGSSPTAASFINARTVFDGNGSETQYVQVTGSNGQFQLSFRGSPTSNLFFSATAADVERALNTLPTIGGVGGSVSVTKAGLSTNPGGATFMVKFGGTLAGQNLPPITFQTSGGTVVVVTTGNDGPEGTEVLSGATLQLNGNMIMDRERVTIHGQGFMNQGALNVNGGNVTWQALNPQVQIPLFLGSNASIGTTLPTDTLTFQLPITDSGNNFNLDIYGPGTVIYASNGTAFLGGTTFTGYTGTTTVHSGTLLLSQAVGNAILGPLVVGDAVGAPDSAVVRETFNNQIADTVTVRVNSDGLFDLNGFTDTVSDVTVAGGHIDTGVGGQLTTGFIQMDGGLMDIRSGAHVTAKGNVDMVNGAKVVGGNGSTLTAQMNLNLTDSTITFGNTGKLAVTNDVTMNSVLSASKIEFGDGGVFTARDVTATAAPAIVDAHITFQNDGVFTARDVSLTNTDVGFGINGAMSVNKLTALDSAISFGFAGNLGATGDVSLTNSALQFADGGTATLNGKLDGTTADIDFGLNGTLTAGDVTLNTSTLDMLDNASATLGNLNATSSQLSFGLGTVGGSSAVSAKNVTLDQSTITFADNASFTADQDMLTASAIHFGDGGTHLVSGNVNLQSSFITFDDAGRLDALDFTMTMGSLLEFLLSGVLNLDDFIAMTSLLTMGTNAQVSMSTMMMTDSTASFGESSNVTVAGPVGLTGSNLSVGIPLVAGDASLLQIGDLTMAVGSGGAASNVLLGADDTGLFGTINATGNAAGGVISAGDNSILNASNVVSNDTDFAFGNTVRFDAGSVDVTNAIIVFGTDGTFNTSGNLTLNNAQVTLGDRVAQDPIFATQAIAMTNGSKITLGASTQGSSLGINMTGSTFTIGTSAVHTLGGNIIANSTAGESAEILGPGSLDMGGTDRTVTVGDGPQDVDLNVTAVIISSPTERLVKTGPGRLRFAPATGFSGPVTILDGDVQADTNIGSVGLKSLTASLSGIGTVGQIDGAPTAGTRSTGTVAPGINWSSNPIGTLNSGNLLWGPTTTFFVNLAHTSVGSPVPGVDNDLLNVTGSVSLNNATLNGLFGAGIQLGDSFTILQSTLPITGRFAEPFGANVVFIEGHKFSVQYNTNSVVLTKILANIVGMNLQVTAPSTNPATQRQNVVLTATMTPEAGAGTISPTNTVTYTFTNTSTMQVFTGTVNVNAGTNTAVFNTTGDITGQPFLPGGSYTVTAMYNGDPVDFTTANASLTGNPLVIEIPIFNTLVATEPVISPDSSAGIKDSTQLNVSVLMERGQLTSYTIEIRNSSNVVVRTLSNPTSPFGPTAPHTEVPISATWDGRGTGNTVLPNGEYTITAAFEDVFGNTGTSNTISVVLDSINPTATPLTNSSELISPGVVGVTTPGTTSFTSTVGDPAFAGFPNGTFEQWTIEIRNSSNTVVRTFTGTNTSVNVTWNGTTNNNTTIVPDGVYTVTITSQDQGGNTFTTSSQTVVVLTNPPTVVGSSNTSTVYGDSITITAVVSVLANDTGVPPSITSLLSGDAVEFFRDSGFSLGTADLALNGGQYTATITVPTFNAGTYSNMFIRYIGGGAEFLTGDSANFTHVVTPAPLTVTAANPVNKQYGSPVPTLNLASGFLTVTGLVNSDLAANVVSGTAATTATISSPVIAAGYPITQGGVTANSNYTLTFVDGRLFVTKAPLTVTIDDKQRPFHGANPPFTFTASTLLLGDPASVVTGFTLQTTANVNSPPGTYPIFAVGTPTAQNYDIVNVINGTLEVIPIPTPIVVGPGQGGAPIVNVYSTAGTFQNSFFAFNPAFTGGVRTGSGDFNRDGVMDIIVGTGPGTKAQVRVLNGVNGAEMFSVFPFDEFYGGVFVAAGDIDGDGADELIITPDQGGGPRVVGYSGITFDPFISYYGINDPDFRGGARAGIGDMNGDGFAEIAVSAGFDGGPRITVWDGKSIANKKFTPLANFFAYDQSLRNGAYVAIGDVDGDGFGDLITGAGPGGAPHVKIFDGADMMNPSIGPGNAQLHASFFAGDQNNRGGVRVAVKSLDNDLKADFVTGVGDGGGNSLSAYLGADITNGNLDSEFDINAFPGFMNGVFVG